MKIELVSIGADPEFAITNGEKMVHPRQFTLGGKYTPEDLGNGFKLSNDNLLLEGNIPPAKSKKGFIRNMKILKDLINSRLGDKYEIAYADEVIYEKEELETPEAHEFGCSASVDVYKEITYSTPRLKGRARPVGAHIHLGLKISDKGEAYDSDIMMAIAKALDYFIALPADEINYSAYRRKTYGKYGMIRFTNYGFEYRSLGGFFLQDKYLGWQYDQVQKAIDFVQQEGNYEKLMQIEEPCDKYYEVLGINKEEQIPVEKSVLI